jgi:acid phosphatase type 7
MRLPSVASPEQLTGKEIFCDPPQMHVSVPMTRFALLACLALAAQWPVSAAANYRFARAPYLQFSTTNSIYVVWRTEGPITPVVRYGKSMDRLDGALSYVSADSGTGIVLRVSLGTNTQSIPSKWQQYRTEENLKLRKLHSAPIGTFQYEARLWGLQPETKYFYAVYDGDKRLTPADESYSFVTPPPIGKRAPVRFWVLGDSGTGRKEQMEVYRGMLEAVNRDQRPLDFWLHLGDMAYGVGRDVEFQARFFESYEGTLRSSVCWPTMGNHEGYTAKGTTGIGPYYDAYVMPRKAEVGGLASGTEAYYSFNWANIHFVCLNSHDMDRKPGGAMAKWLKADLEKTKADWIVAFFHHPPYTKGSHDSDKEKDLQEMRQHIMPILESAGVDVVLAGHSHIYERSMLIDGSYGATNSPAENNVLDDGDGDPNGDGPYRKSAGIHPHEGTVAVVAGHSGAAISRKGTIPLMKRTMAEFGSVIFDVNGDTLEARMINRNGKVRDLFSMVKRGKVEPVRLALPWQPEEYKKPTNSVSHEKAQAPVDYKVLIPRGAEWEYVAAHPLGQLWTRKDFDASQWQKGPAGFGFGNAEVRTELTRSRDRKAIYLRREFNIEQADKVTELGLLIDYRDAFIAYINGREVARQNVGRSSGRNVQKLKAREESGISYVVLKDAHKVVKDGANILAIEVHAAPDSLDLHIDPQLILED